MITKITTLGEEKANQAIKVDQKYSKTRFPITLLLQELLPLLEHLREFIHSVLTQYFALQIFNICYKCFPP